MDSTGKPSTGWTDQAKAKVSEGTAGEQGPNGFQTGWDSEKVSETARAIEHIAAGWTPQNREVQMLRIMCDLVQEQPDRLAPGIDQDHWGFEAWEIGERLQERFKVSGAVGWKKDQERGRRRMNTYWDDLGATWTRELPTIVDGLDALGHPLRLRLDRKKGGGTGNRSRYGFRLDDDADARPIAEAPPPDLDLLKTPLLTYRRQDISGSRLVGWMSNRGFYLGGWGGKVFAGTSLIVLIVAFVWLWLLMLAMSHTSAALTFLQLGMIGAITLLLVYLFLGWQMRLVANRVAIAPMLLQPWSRDDYLLELRNEKGATRNTMYLVRYAADCPICGEHGKEAIRVASGRWEFFGRLVGRCDRAPNAHVFSFDHISQRGRFLR